jgi:hypothetical protein
MSNSQQRFWVIGGVYADMNFQALADGAQSLFGPFQTREEGPSSEGLSEVP